MTQTDIMLYFSFAATVVIMVAATVVIMVAATVAILKLTLLIRINLQAQKVGKIEVMETLLKTLNLKVVEAEEKEESQMRVMFQMKRINNPFLQA